MPIIAAIRPAIRKTAATLAVLFVAIAIAAPAQAAEPVFSADGAAIKGYDPVAYFTEEDAIAGKPEFTHDYMGATWRFASAENRDTFAANPEKYAPQYGGYCAYAVSQGYIAPIDPDAWSVRDGKLYLNYSLPVRIRWSLDKDGYIAAANTNWPGLRDAK